jgi:GH15 family glucan-1,4-alpha-glucosidase
VAAEIKLAVEKHLWQPDEGYFAKMLYQSDDELWQTDLAADASLSGLWQFGMYPVDDPKIVSSMEVIRQKLWVKTEIGGIARYENDGYHQVSQGTSTIPGNPWFVTTMWVAEWLAETARSESDLETSLELLLWAAEHTLPSGIMAEQLHPTSGEPLSVSPLTWSHATYVTSVLAYLKARQRLKQVTNNEGE